MTKRKQKDMNNSSTDQFSTKNGHLVTQALCINNSDASVSNRLNQNADCKTNMPCDVNTLAKSDYPISRD